MATSVLKPLLLCLMLLSAAARPLSTTRSTATSSLSVALSSTKSASSSAWHLVRSRVPMPQPVSMSVCDCAILLADAVKQLQRSVDVMARPQLAVEVGDVQTWTSASLTDANTCLEELGGTPKLVKAVMTLKRRVMEAAQLTSNALASVNDYSSSRNHPRHHRPRKHP